MRTMKIPYLIASVILLVALAPSSRAATAFSWDTRTATPLNIGGGLNEGRLMTEAGTDTIFAMRGDNAATLYRYIISQDAWTQMNDLTGTLAGGGTLEQNGIDTIFVLSGGLSQAFTRYVISADAWTAMLDIPQVVQGGGALVSAGDDTIFATPGVGTMSFYRYTISTNSWTQMLDAPGTIDAGAALARAGDDTIFALRGGLNPDFYRYIISSNTWSAMTSLPTNVQGGGSLLYPGSGNFIYATRGDNSRDMYRYSISADNWTLISDTAPNTFQAGGGLAYPGSGNFLYGLHGGVSTSFSRFYLDSAAPNTPTGLAQTKPDMTPVGLNDQVTDTNAIRFNVFASGTGSETFRIQVELRAAGTAFTSPASPAIDTVTFFQSAPSASASGETISILADSLANGQYHWQARAVGGITGLATSWVTFDAADTHFRIALTGNIAPTIVPIAPQSRTEDTAAWTVTLTPFGNDTDFLDLPILFWSVAGGGTIVNVSMDDSQTLRITPIANRNGTESVTIRLSDNKDTSSDTLAITLTAVNDTPTVGTISINSDSTIRPIDSTFLRITGSFDVDTATNGDSLNFLWSVVSGPGGTFSNATSDSTYFFPTASTDGVNVIRVMVRDSALAGDSRSTTVLVDSFPPFGFAPSAPAHGHETSATTITFTWTAASDTGAGFDSYRIQIDSSTAFTNPHVDSPRVTTSSTHALASNETWYWRIIARDTVGNTATSDSFRLRISTPNDTPTIFPAVPAQTRNEDTAPWTVGLTAHTNDSSPADSIIAFWSVTGGGTIVTASMTDSRTLQITPLVNQNGIETVTLRLSDNKDTIIQALAITLVPVNDTPTVGTISINSDSTIRPIDSTFLKITGSVDVDTATNGDSLNFLWSVVSGPGGTFSNATSDSTYFFPTASTDGVNVIRVMVRDSALAGDSRSTTVLVDSFPPFGFAPSAPAHGHETTSTSITFTWNAASDTGAGFDSYRLQIDSSTSFTNPRVDSPTTLTSLTRTLPSGETYFWRIIARDTVGNTATSDSFRIRINAVPNDTPTIFPAVSAQSRPEDTVAWTVGLTAHTNDSDPADSIIAFWSVTGGGTIVTVSMIDSRTLNIAPVANQNGTETVTLRLSDNKDTITQALAITLVPVNDTPTAGTISTNTDSTIRPIDSTFLRVTGFFDIDTSTNGDSLNFLWSVVSGPGGSFSNATSDSTYFFPTASTDGVNVIRVLVRDSALAGDSRSTTVLVDSFPPFGFAPSAPAHGHETSATSITFTWTAASDTGAGFDSYRFQLDSSTAFTNPFVDSPLTTTTATRTLATNETWYWRIIARDTVGNTRTSDSFRLRINAATTPNTVTISGAAAFTFSPGTFSTDSAQIRVTDINGGALAGIVPTYSVVAKPTGATGESITYTPSDATGISQLNLLAGNVAGVYVVKVVVGSLSPVYVGFHTLEYDLPATLWRLIAVNRVPTNATVSQALSGLAPTSIFHWNPSIASHAINLRYEVPTSFVSGDGYYLRNATAVRFSVSGSTLVTDTRDIALKEGWNMVGTPYANLTRWNASQIVSSGGTVMTPAAAEAAGIIQNKIFWYKDNAYQFGPGGSNADPILTPWNGFWLKAHTAATLRLSPYFYFSEASAPLASAQAVGSISDWQARVTVRGDGGNEFVNFFGVSPTASNVENPPIVSGQFAGGLGLGGAYAQELKAPFTTAQRWDFTVTPTTTDNLVTLTFGDLGNLPAGFVAMLVDLSNGAQTMLGTTTTYQFSASGLAQSRSFRILAGTEAQVRALAIPALSTSNTFVTPNPGPDAAGNVLFKYNATAGGTLKLRVFDLGGRNVIDRTIDLNTNPTEYSWNCRNEQGQSISTGVYIYVLDYAAPTEKRRITEKLVIFR